MTPVTALDRALEYRLKGWAVIDVPLRSKNPNRDGWQLERLDEAAIRERFHDQCNVSALLGEPSGGLVDMDLDCAEARRLASTFLPPSNAIFGRAGSPGSHVLYVCDPLPSTKRFQDPCSSGEDGRNVLLEIRSTGTHTLFPGSLHPNGEAIEWLRDDEPPSVSGDELLNGAQRLAAASLLARHWPVQGSRQDAALALSGGLLRAGWDAADAGRFVRAVATGAGDEETSKRETAAASTEERLREAGDATGWPRLEELLDRRVVARLREWLGIATGSNSDKEPSRRSQADDLVDIGRSCELFTDSFDGAMVVLRVESHAEVWPLHSRHFDTWLRQQYWRTLGKTPGGDAVRSALGVLEGLARFEGAEHELNNRVARVEGQIYYDLADTDWSRVVIGPDGWTVEGGDSPLFRRFAHQKRQVLPERGGDVWRIFDFLNVTERHRLLLLCWLIAGFIPDIPHPILDFYGEKGAGKTIGGRVLRRLLDPSAAESLAFPTDKRELVQQLSHHYAPIYDNLDNLPPLISDIFCRAVTGEAFSKRELFSDDDDVIYAYVRVLLLNGINVAPQRPDLLDRSILIGLERISGVMRREEKQLWKDFELARPSILGGIFDALVVALRVVDNLRLPELERMADFNRYGAAIAFALGREPDEFVEAYSENIRQQSREAVEANLVGGVILAFMSSRESWTGTPTALLQSLESTGYEAGLLQRSATGRISNRGWPGAAHILTRRLAEIHSNLRDQGISMEGSHSGSRQVDIVRLGDGESSVQSVQATESEPAMDAMDALDAEIPTQQDLWGARI